jgi:hypothetical protein
MLGLLKSADRKRPAEPYSVQTDALLVYLLSTIDVRVSWLEAKGKLGEAETHLLKEIKERRGKLAVADPAGMTENSAWTEAYLLERLMALLEPFQNLLPEIRLRLDEATSERVPAEARLRSMLAAEEARAFDTSKTPPELRATSESTLRNLLLETLEELHFSYKRKYFGRPLQRRAISIVVLAALGTFVLVLVPYMYMHYNYFPTGASGEKWSWLPLFTALSAGLFGACFSRLLYIQRNSDIMSIGELKQASQAWDIFLRGVVGVCGALVVFFFLQSGIVGGSVFPNIQEAGIRVANVPLIDPAPAERQAGEQQDTRSGNGSVAPAIPLAAEGPLPPAQAGNTAAQGSGLASLRLVLPNTALALLAIWCFLAGFSERLVPSILTSTEQRLEGAATGSKK